MLRALRIFMMARVVKEEPIGALLEQALMQEVGVDLDRLRTRTEIYEQIVLRIESGAQLIPGSLWGSLLIGRAAGTIRDLLDREIVRNRSTGDELASRMRAVVEALA